MSKKLEEKQRRRLEAEQRKAAQRAAHRKANIVTILIALGIAAAVIVAVLFLRPSGGDEAVGVAAEEAGCTDIEEHEIQGNEHVDAGTEVQYETSPPTSGPHWPPDQVADAAFYTTPIEEERLVHNMEHGQLVFWYRPDVSEGVLDQLRQVQEQERIATIVVPSDLVPDGYTFTMTAWGASQSCEQVSQEVIDEFREGYQGRGPENVGIPTFNR